MIFYSLSYDTFIYGLGFRKCSGVGSNPSFSYFLVPLNYQCISFGLLGTSVLNTGHLITSPFSSSSANCRHVLLKATFRCESQHQRSYQKNTETACCLCYQICSQYGKCGQRPRPRPSFPVDSALGTRRLEHRRQKAGRGRLCCVRHEDG